MTTRQAEVNNGVTTTWVPFTTPGPSAVPSCSAQMYFMPGSQEIVAFDPWQGKNIPYQLQCLPAEVFASYFQVSPASVVSKLGPMHCPSMYTTASTLVVSQISTSVICCPSQYTWVGNDCLSTQTAGYITPESLVVSDGSWVSWTHFTVASTGIVVHAVKIDGYLFGTASATNLNIKTESIPAASTATTSSSSDKSSSTSSTSSPSQPSPLVTSTVASASGSITTIYSTLTPISTSPPPSSSSRARSTLSTGAIAGIAVGCALCGIGIGILSLLFVLSRRNRKEPDSGGIYHEKDGMAARKVVHELSGAVSAGEKATRYEMDGERQQRQ